MTDLAIQSTDAATSRVNHTQHLLSLPAGVPPDQQAATLLRALIELDHGPGRKSHADKDYENTIRLAEE